MHMWHQIDFLRLFRGGTIWETQSHDTDRSYGTPEVRSVGWDLVFSLHLRV